MVRLGQELLTLNNSQVGKRAGIGSRPSTRYTGRVDRTWNRKRRAMAIGVQAQTGAAALPLRPGSVPRHPAPFEARLHIRLSSWRLHRSCGPQVSSFLWLDGL